jgi:hypothetical protein
MKSNEVNQSGEQFFVERANVVVSQNEAVEKDKLVARVNQFHDMFRDLSSDNGPTTSRISYKLLSGRSRSLGH